VQKLKEYKALRILKAPGGKETWKAVQRGELMPRPDHFIIEKYNSEIRGLYNYYWLATNVK
jgi:Type II intron maturase.